MTTICFVGPSAFAPVHSALTLFRSEFESRVTKRVTIPVTSVSSVKTVTTATPVGVHS